MLKECTEQKKIYFVIIFAFTEMKHEKNKQAQFS